MAMPQVTVPALAVSAAPVLPMASVKAEASIAGGQRRRGVRVLLVEHAVPCGDCPGAGAGASIVADPSCLGHERLRAIK